MPGKFVQLRDFLQIIVDVARATADNLCALGEEARFCPAGRTPAGPLSFREKAAAWDAYRAWLDRLEDPVLLSSLPGLHLASERARTRIHQTDALLEELCARRARPAGRDVTTNPHQGEQ